MIARRAPILRSPLKRRTPRQRKGADPAYLAFIRRELCVICLYATGSEDGAGHIEAAHTGVRGLGQKCPDNQALPLCVRHHRTGPHSHHVLGKRFWTFHNLEREHLIADHQQRYMAEGGKLL